VREQFPEGRDCGPRSYLPGRSGTCRSGCTCADCLTDIETRFATNFRYTVGNYYHDRHSGLRITPANPGRESGRASARARMRACDSLLPRPAFAETECRNLQGNCTWPLIKRGVIRQMVAYYRASERQPKGSKGIFSREISLDLAAPHRFPILSCLFINSDLCCAG